MRNNVLKQSVDLCLFSLIGAQLVGSWHGAHSCSYMLTVMISRLSTRCLIQSRVCVYKYIYILYFIMSLCPRDIPFITESVSCRPIRKVAWWREHQIWRSWTGCSGWITTSSRNDHRQSPCRQCVEAARRNRSRALREMNLFKSKVAGQAIKVRLDEKRKGMSQRRVHAQIPCRPCYQEELPARRLLLNNVRGVDEHNACNGITAVFTMRLIQCDGSKPGFPKASFCVIIRRVKKWETRY